MSNHDAPVALVTGGARRVGATIVRTLHAAGLSVLVHYRTSAGAARELAAELAAARPGSVALERADLLERGAPARVVAAALEAFGRLDVLVNNASSFYPTPLGAIGEAEWEDLLGTNLKAPALLCQAAAPALGERRGCIVNLADVHGLRPLARHAPYCAAKAGLVMLTRVLARELAPEVRVNAVAPGAILWPEGEADEAARAAVIARTPLGRRGDPADVAGAVRYLALEAPYVTGQVLAVDGGQSA